MTLDNLKNIIKNRSLEQINELLKLTFQKFKEYMEKQSLYWVIYTDTSKPLLKLIRKMVSQNIINITCLPQTIVNAIYEMELNDYPNERHYCSPNSIKLELSGIQYNIESINNKKIHLNGDEISMNILYVINHLKEFKDEILIKIAVEIDTNTELARDIYELGHSKINTMLLMKGLVV